VNGFVLRPAPGAPAARALLAQLLDLVGEPPLDDGGPSVAIDGSDPVFPTVFPIGEAGAAVIAACALQAGRIWQDRTGQSQQVAVQVDAAAAAMRSGRYLRPDPPPALPRRLGGLSTYRTGDGRFIYFQRLFPHHNERLSKVLGVPLEEPALSEAVARWDGAALEEAVNAGGSCAGLVRTRAEWLALPVAAHVAAAPLIDLTALPGGPPKPVAAGPRPLSGLRVLDLTRVLAGPTSARTLAEHGADVLRVSVPGLPDNDAMMKDTGHGKRSVELDLKSRAGAERLRELIAAADVFIQGYRPGALAALGFGADDVAALNPSVVTVDISAYGHLGPWRDRRGFDSVVQSASGLAVANAGAGGPGAGDPGTGDAVSAPPVFLPANPLDYTTGYLAALGALAALRRRARAGGSHQVRVSLARTGEWLWELPRLDAADAAARPKELPAGRLDELMISSQTPFGRLRYLAPAARLTATPAHWDLPTPLPNQDDPAWLGS
jgi:crotonobetainyl-CoA:carnitine CoA-transferase CaiB-like acyl-CoA transferase